MTAGRQLVRRADERFGQSTPGNLIGVRGQEEAIHQYGRVARKRRFDHLVHDLRPRCHEEQRLRSRPDIRAGVEHERANRVAERGAPGLAHRDTRRAASGKPFFEATQLRGLPRPFGTLEHDEPATHSRHPSVMMGLADPFLMPSKIQSFTRSITLSKFS